MKTISLSALSCALGLAAAPALAVTCASGIPASNPDAIYTSHGDGTVSDSRTGLMWDLCAWGQTGADCSGDAATTHAWGDALAQPAVANAMNAGAGYKGYTDWRLPNVEELRSLVEHCRVNPAINDSVFPPPPSEFFWTSSPGTSATQAWHVSFQVGYSEHRSRGDGRYVRLVRGGPAFDTFDAALDYTPDALGDYPPASNSAGAVTAAASGKTLGGLATVTGIQITGEGSPQYRVHDGTAWGGWTSTPGVVKNGDQVQVRLTAGPVGSVRTATLTVGGQTADFQVTANGAGGTQPVPVLGPLGLMLLSGLLGGLGFAVRRR